MKIEQVLISPSKAKEYLLLNTNNRTFRQTIVDLYAKQMLAGEWQEDTAETIKIAGNRLIDGQHRLLALIKANVSLRFLVASEMKETVFKCIDSGLKRSASDAFESENIKNSRKIPATIQTYFHFKNGRYSGAAQKVLSLTTAQLLDIYYDKPHFWQEVASNVNRWYKDFTKILEPSLIGGFYCLFYDIDKTSAFVFMEQLSTGMHVTNNSILLLRQKLTQDKLSTKKITPFLRNAYIIKTWNAFRLNQNLRILKYQENENLILY